MISNTFTKKKKNVDTGLLQHQLKNGCHQSQLSPKQQIKGVSNKKNIDRILSNKNSQSCNQDVSSSCETTKTKPSSKYPSLIERISQIQQQIEKTKISFDITLQTMNPKEQTFTQNEEQNIDLKPQVFSQSKPGNFEKQEEKQCPDFVTQVSDLHGDRLGFNIYQETASIYYISEVVRQYKSHNSLVRQHIKSSIEFLINLSKIRMPHKNQLESRKLNIPMKTGFQNKITLIFDLDETLIHYNSAKPSESQVFIPIQFPNGTTTKAGINIRPGAQSLLTKLAKHFEIMIFTASLPFYANAVIDYLDPYKQNIHHRLYRQHCDKPAKSEQFIKDLRIINRKMSKMLLIDNAAYSYAYQIQNGIPILPYYEGKDDYELEGLYRYLMKFKDCQDVRALNRQTFKLMHYVEYKIQQIEDLIEDLYL